MNNLGFLLAEGALKVAKDDQRDRRIRGSKAGGALDVELVEVLLKRIPVDVVNLAAEDLFAVLRNEKMLRLRRIVVRQVDRNVQEAGQFLGLLGVVDFDGDVGTPELDMAQVSFERGFVESGLVGGGGECERSSDW